MREMKQGGKTMKQVFTLLAGIIGGLAGAGLILLLLSPPRGHPVTLVPLPTPEPYTVDLCGAVVLPGVYRLEPGTIAADAIAAAGGVTEKADLAAINLAAEIKDGQKLFIPYLQPTNIPGEQPLPAQPGSGLINLNLAGAPELEQLPGIGPATAKKIVEYRDSHGPFLSVEDLLNVSGIGPAKLEQIRDFVTVY
jgi:competence protein ComEA